MYEVITADAENLAEKLKSEGREDDHIVVWAAVKALQSLIGDNQDAGNTIMYLESELERMTYERNDARREAELVRRVSNVPRRFTWEL